MRLGFQVSIEGGYSRALERGKKLGCDCIQFFIGNPRGWEKKAPSEEDIASFKRENSFFPLIAHASYLIRPGSRKKKVREKSMKGMEFELMHAHRLGVNYYVIHAPGKDQDVKFFIEALKSMRGEVEILVENTAKSSFSSLIPFVDAGFGICLDTAHAFQAGYDWKKEETIREIEKTIGMENIKLLHLNDSKTGMGSGKDIHWHIGKGKIGVEGFRCLLPHFLHLPGIMETPRKSDEDDRRNMEAMRKILEEL
ncbi:hypothetical protein DRQ20_02070 [bacterium]|nr:MAG: hypothetical protein DRQ20_02070 [bacterium]